MLCLRCAQHGNWEHVINGLSLSDKYAEYRSYDEPPDGTGIYDMVARTKQTFRMTQEELVSQVVEGLHEPDGVIVFDPSAFVKKGTESVGVARQWCGCLGKCGQLPGRRLHGICVARGTHPGGYVAVSAEELGEGQKATKEVRCGQGCEVSNTT